MTLYAREHVFYVALPSHHIDNGNSGGGGKCNFCCRSGYHRIRQCRHRESAVEQEHNHHQQNQLACYCQWSTTISAPRTADGQPTRQPWNTNVACNNKRDWVRDSRSHGRSHLLKLFLDGTSTRGLQIKGKVLQIYRTAASAPAQIILMRIFDDEWSLTVSPTAAFSNLWQSWFQTQAQPSSGDHSESAQGRNQQWCQSFGTALDFAASSTWRRHSRWASSSQAV